MKRVLKWIGFGLLAVLSLAILMAAGGWCLLRASLAQLDGHREMIGLSGPVTIERDSLGVPAITASNRNDAAHGLGFVHAQERFFQMDTMRRAAAGEVGELFGEFAVDWVDVPARKHRFRHRAQLAVAAGGAQEREVLAAYTMGVNAGLAALGARPPEYFALRQQPVPWRDEDSVLVAFTIFATLQDRDGAGDNARGWLEKALGPEAYRFFTQAGSSWDAAVDDSVLPPIAVPPQGTVDFRPLTNPPPARRVDKPGPATKTTKNVRGSNNWAVDGRRSGTGAAIVANDMHLELAVPNTWFRARLRYRDAAGVEQDVVGVTLPGTPAVIAGSNRHIAWGVTAGYLDTTDVVRLETDPANPRRYRTPDGWRELETFTEEIRVHGSTNRTVVFDESLWGPLITVRGATNPLALRWVAHLPGAVNLRMVEFERATNVAQALALAPSVGAPTLNLVVGDATGNIGYTVMGALPDRFGFDGLAASTWVDGTRGWRGLLPADRYPRLVNPPDGLLWTANNRVLGSENYLKLGPYSPDCGARARQIRDDLRAMTNFTERTLWEIYRDDRALFLERWQKLLLEVLDRGSATNRDWRETRDLVANWGGRATPGNQGYLRVSSFRGLVSASLKDPLVRLPAHRFLPSGPGGESVVWTMLEERPPHLLSADFTSYDDLLRNAAEVVVRRHVFARTNPPAKAAEPPGTYHIRHRLSLAVPQLSRWLDMTPARLPGDHNMPRVSGDGFGVSERLVVSPGREEQGLFNMPGGQSGHFLSPFYRAGHDAWVNVQPLPLLPGPVKHTLVLEPGRP